MMNILRKVTEHDKQKLVLIGDFWLCLKLRNSIAEQNNQVKYKAVYLDVLEEHKEKKAGMMWISRMNCQKTAFACYCFQNMWDVWIRNL